MENNQQNHLVRTLGPLTLWGLGVGYVISGMYFGWNLGLAEGGTLGLAMATLFIIVLYTTFIFSYTELACDNMFGHVSPLGKKDGFLIATVPL
jgi:ethanolamine permease